MNKKDFEKYLNLAVSTGADFAEIYYEKNCDKNYNLIDSKLDQIQSNNSIGLGIRITMDKESFYSSTNDLTSDNIENIIMKMLKNIPIKKEKRVLLTDLVDKTKKVNIPHDDYPVEKKKELLTNIDKIARNESKLINQVSASIIEQDREFTIANSDGKYIKSNAILTRICATVFAERDTEKQKEFTDFAGGIGYEILDKYDVKEAIVKVSKTAVEKLDAVDFKGGELPVVIAPGFGAVIFHEACGHSLEATSVATGRSQFCGKLGETVASPIVTAIDDGTEPNSWGSNNIDDEGRPTQKLVLIENGILKNYLIDRLGSRRMNMPPTGCGRRENYHYEPTSRMSNTYIAAGKDDPKEIIGSTESGLYAAAMGGGSVNPVTGEFNFAVREAYMIRNGEIAEPVRGATLIGKGSEILPKIDRVSSNLASAQGMCGSKSGSIPTNVGQPMIRVSSITVGGR